MEARLQVDARALHPQGAAFVAGLPHLAARARVDAAGASLTWEDDRGPGLHVDTRAWGRRGTLRPLGEAAPTAGSCTTEATLDGACVRRVERQLGALTEWWVGLDNGLEQGWTVSTPPAGPGELVLDVHLAGAESEAVGGASATLRDAAGRAWTVSGLAAWDAAGDRLSVTVEPADQGLRFVVDDRGATYPLTIDPTYTSADTQLVSGQGRFGSTATRVGDLNGDGYDDVAVGAPYSGSGTGRVYLFYGTVTGLPQETTAFLSGAIAAQYFGLGLGGGGDVNGDGYDDLVVGSLGDLTQGEARVFYGGPTTPTRADSTVLDNTSAALTQYGRALAIVPDTNGDGYDDILVGEKYHRAGSSRTHAGRVWYYMGAASGVVTTATTTVEGTAASAELGSAVAGLGDVDGDGYGDVAWSAPGYSSSTGQVFVAYGAATGLAATTTTLTGASSGGEFGAGLAGAGDVDGDGHADLLIGEPGYFTETGRVHVHHGSSSGVGLGAMTAITGPRYQSRFGAAVDGGGDLNGDGYDDIIVGAPRHYSYTGGAFVYLGASTGVSSTVAHSVAGTATGDELGTAVAVLGDVDGDGYDDAIVGSPKASSYLGEAVVLGGAAAGPSAATEGEVLPPQNSLYFGQAIASLDLDGDGIDDLVVGDGQWESGLGRVHVHMGTADGIPEAADLVVACPGASSGTACAFGEALYSAGDVNGDGYDDLVVGAPDYVDASSGSNGLAFVFYGSSSGISSTPDATLTATSSSSSFGARVVGAGDVNGDGYDDIGVADLDATYGYGLVDIFHGSASGISTHRARTLANPGSFRQFGAMGRGGDFNGDGYDDLAIVPLTSVAHTYVFYGSSAGLYATSSLTLSYGCEYIDGAGDANGDGYDDLVVGNSTGICVFPGSASGLSSGVSTCFRNSTTTRSTNAAAWLGDVDGDGYDDVAYGGAIGNYVFVHLGGSGGISSSPDATIHETGIGDLVAGGDFDGDGIADIATSLYQSGVLVYLTSGADSDGDGVPAAVDCDDTDASVGAATASLYWDDDGDGYGDPSVGAVVCPGTSSYVADDTDCDDADATIHPGATEGTGDEVDQDCDGAETCYADADEDGYRDRSGGTVTSSDTDCSDAGEADDSAATGDCDDGDPDVHPGATEQAGDGVDQDCDGTETCLVDADSDGYRADAVSTVASADEDCSDAGEALATTPDGDCDDADPAVSPGATEIPGDGQDQDCDGTDTCYVDADGDGYRGTDTVASADLDCSDGGEADASYPSGDCDDGDGAIHPGATEVAGDEIDQDCDGSETCYADADADGYTDGTVTSADDDCTDSGEATTASADTDCDDADGSVHPGATELPGDEVDQDCDGAETCYVDADDDGYRTDGGATVTSSDTSCSNAGEAAATVPTGDCDDTDGSIHPGATELPGDEVDQDCDGTETCYVDADDDGFRRDSAYSTPSADTDCADAGEATALTPDGDCDDHDGAVHPGAAELPGDELDQDCDGSEDCYTDGDGDGYRVDTLVTSADTDCRDAGEAGSASSGGDCDDTAATVHPGAVEVVGDEVDQDCDGAELCYIDDDDDGYRIDASVASLDADCQDPGESTATSPGGDCDDADDDVHPQADEGIADGIDQDCDGEELCYADRDGDGYRPDASATVESTDLACDGMGEADATVPTGDCEDADPGVHPGAEDVPEDGIDQDCAGGDATDDGGDGGSDGDPVADGDGKGEDAGCASTGPRAPTGLLVLGATLLATLRRRRTAGQPPGGRPAPPSGPCAPSR